MKQYTRKQLKEYARLGLARDLTTVDPDTLPPWKLPVLNWRRCSYDKIPEEQRRG